MPYSIVLTIKRTIAFVCFSLFLAGTSANAATVCSTGGTGTTNSTPLYFARFTSGTCSTPSVPPMEPGIAIGFFGEGLVTAPENIALVVQVQPGPASYEG